MENSFLEGTGDDGDIFTALGDPAGAYGKSIGQDTIHDMDIGQNSLSLVGELGEQIYLRKDSFDDIDVVVSADTSATSGYTAVVTLTNSTTETSGSFTLANLNLPTTALWSAEL